MLGLNKNKMKYNNFIIKLYVDESLNGKQKSRLL